MPLNHDTPNAELTNEQFAALGRVVVEWANIEFLLSVLLSRLLRTPEFLGRTYANGLTAVRMQEAISEAVEIHRYRYGFRLIPEAVLDDIVSLNSQVTSVRSDRNRISHFCWSRTTDEAIFGTSFPGGVPSSKWGRRHHRTISLAELHDLHQRSRLLVAELRRINDSIETVGEVPPNSLL